MASIRKRSWTTSKGEPREAWIVDYFDQNNKRHLKTFARKKEADAWIVDAAHVMKVILDNEKGWAFLDAQSPETPLLETRDSSLEFGNRIVSIASTRGLTPEYIDMLIYALETIEHAEMIHDLRQNLHEDDFDPDYVVRLDALIDSNWPR